VAARAAWVCERRSRGAPEPRAQAAPGALPQKRARPAGQGERAPGEGLGRRRHCRPAAPRGRVVPRPRPPLPIPSRCGDVGSALGGGRARLRERGRGGGRGGGRGRGRGRRAGAMRVCRLAACCACLLSGVRGTATTARAGLAAHAGTGRRNSDDLALRRGGIGARGHAARSRPRRPRAPA
jgi:hypothetical protein